MRAQLPPAHAQASWLAQRAAFDDGHLETLKWIAMASMLLDHVGRFWFTAGEDGWVFAGGRVAFPLFAMILGYNLGRTGDRERRAARTASRLGLWGLVAIVPSVWMRGHPYLLNVLFTLALGATVSWALAAGPGRVAPRAVVVAIACAASLRVEFELAGVLLVTAAFLWSVERSPRAALAVIAMLGLTAWGNAQFGGWLSFAATVLVLPLAFALRALPLQVPRVKLAFYLIYPLHMALIAALRPGPAPGLLQQLMSS